MGAAISEQNEVILDLLESRQPVGSVPPEPGSE